MDGWIKLHRKITEWEWYKDIPVRILFEHLLLTATHKEITRKNKTIKPGSRMTSLSELSHETGLSMQQIRTALNKLKSTCEVTCEITNQNSIITVNNWNLYQPINTQDNTQVTRPCYNKNIRREEESSSKTTDNVVYIGTTHFDVYGSCSNVYLSKRQYGALLTQSGSEKLLAILIDELSENIASKSDKDKVFDEKYPDMHYIRLSKYLKNYLERKRKEQPNEPRPYRPYG